MMLTTQTHNLNLLPQSVRLSLLIALTTTMGMSAAQADLVIHNEPTTKIVEVSPVTAMSTTNTINTATMPTEASIMKLMAVMRIDEQIDAIVNGQQAAIAVINERSNTGELAKDDDELNERQQAIREQIQGLLGQYAKIMTGSISEATDSETLTQAYITAAKTYYTQQEVDAQIKFYDTPVGQSILDKQPQVTAAFLKQSLPKDMEATEEQLGQMLPQIKKIFKDIF